jgi:hypothetical protein
MVSPVASRKGLDTSALPEGDDRRDDHADAEHQQ